MLYNGCDNMWKCIKNDKNVLKVWVSNQFKSQILEKFGVIGLFLMKMCKHRI